VDGHFAEDLSSLHPHKKGIHVGSLGAALASGHPILQKHLAQYADIQKKRIYRFEHGFLYRRRVHLSA